MVHWDEKAQVESVAVQEVTRRLRLLSLLLVLFGVLATGAFAYNTYRSQVDKANWREYFETRLDTLDSHTYYTLTQPSPSP